MRVLMLSPDAQMIDRRILQEAHTLIAAGYQVDLLSGFECREADAYEDRGLRVKRYVYDWRDRRQAELQPFIGEKLTRLAWPAFQLAYHLLGKANAFEAFVLEKVQEHAFDVVHVHDFPMLRAGAMAAKLRGVPLIYDSHEFYPIQACFSLVEQKRHLAREKKLTRLCSRVITVNPYIAGMLSEAHDIALPDVILNACERPESTANDLDHAARRQLRIRKGLPPDDFIFVYQGWLSPERNLEPMIEAMARQPANVRLVVVGYGDHITKLKEIAARSKAAERIIFYGRVESDDLPELTRLCDVGIIPYRAVDEMHRYCSPNKLFEFISAQVPILASDLPYLRDVIAGHRIGWLGELDSPESVARHMNAIVADSEAIARARSNLPEAAAALNWSIEGDKLLEIYRQVAPLAASRNSSPPPAISRQSARGQPRADYAAAPDVQ